MSRIIVKHRQGSEPLRKMRPVCHHFESTTLFRFQRFISQGKISSTQVKLKSKMFCKKLVLKTRNTRFNPGLFPKILSNVNLYFVWRFDSRLTSLEPSQNISNVLQSTFRSLGKLVLLSTSATIKVYNLFANFRLFGKANNYVCWNPFLDTLECWISIVIQTHIV